LLAALARGVVPVLWSDVADEQVPVGADVPVPLLLAAPEPAPGTWPRPRIDLPAAPLAPADRRAALAAALPELDPPTHPVGPASLEPGDLALAAADVRATGSVGWAALAERVDARTTDAVPPGAELVHPRASWSDLVLPADRTAQLREAVDRMRAQDRVLDAWGLARGRTGLRGLRLLFAGPPGTGKSLAAEVVAAELGRDLLVVDLSRLVSKWLGETEKNLAAVFDAAERGGAALLFDEADALFGKRTEVGDARDRYANLETAYLLGRLERFEGVAVLATNLQQNMDVAFARRLEFVVTFDPPDEAARLALWRAHLPPAAPLADDVDLATVAALYDLSGALIRNAALAAAFLAAAAPAEERVITAAHLTHAIRREHVKAGLSFPGPVPGAIAAPPSRREPS
uniref:ATP-binding protein n=1 Tax=Pseudonocardia lacus TaxID=2835865 RepID=UPI001BDC257D